jgi:two-component system OmpR family sensor kinase/two-component system sensor histidine kinase BaeS
MRVRLILSFILVVLVSVGGVVLLARRGAAREVRALMYRGTMIDPDELAQTLEDYYAGHQSWEGVEALLPGAGQNGRGQGMGGVWGGRGMGMMGQRVRLAGADGTVLVDSAGEALGTALTPEEQTDAIALHTGLSTAGYLLPESGMGMTLADQRLLVTRLNRAALLGGLAAGALALFLALFLAYRLTRPVQALTQAAARLAEGDLSQRVPVSGYAETAALGEAFNRMAGALQQAEANRQALTADIAHELRNPLAVQRASLEAIQDGVYPLTPENLEPILEQNRLLARLVDDLRTLALADAGQLSLEKGPVDLPGLVGQVVERFRPQAESRPVRIGVVPSAGPGGFPALRADPQRIEQILNNLLSNALRYTPNGGAIEIRLDLAPAAAGLRPAAKVSVRDSGPGIPPESLPRVFERFYRADRARSRAEGGSGLGLAISRQLAHLHGGDLTAANSPTGGAVFTLTLPVESND